MHVIWYTSDNPKSAMRMARYLAYLDLVSAHALTVKLIHFPGQPPPPGYPRLTTREIRELAEIAEIHNHWHDHWRPVDLTTEEIVEQFRLSSGYWRFLLGPDSSALKVAAVPYYGTAETRQIAMSGQSWPPYQFVLSNWLRPPEAVELPAGYSFRWATPWKSDIEAELLWATGGSDRVLIVGYHEIVDEPVRPNQMRWSDFTGWVELAQGLGIEATTLLQLAE